MTALKKLNLWTTQVSDASVEAISGLPNIISLNLDKTAVTDAGIKHLEKLPGLQWLHIGSNDSVTNESVPTLCTLTNLEHLEFTFTGIDDDGYDQLDDALYDLGCRLVK